MNSQCDALADRFRSMGGDGLVDVKFLLRNMDEATTEQVCHEVTEMLNAYQGGNAVPLDFKDSNRQ